MRRTRVSILFKKCLELKGYGVDAFLDYQAHVDLISIRIFTGGWKAKKSPDINIAVPVEEHKEEYYGNISLAEAENILDELLEENRKGRNN